MVRRDQDKRTFRLAARAPDSLKCSQEDSQGLGCALLLASVTLGHKVSVGMQKRVIGCGDD